MRARRRRARPRQWSGGGCARSRCTTSTSTPGTARHDWPEAFTHRLLHELVTIGRDGDGSRPAVAVRVTRGLADIRCSSATGTPAVTVSGPGHDLAAWLSGRGDGTALAVEPGRHPARTLRLDVTS